MKRTVLVGLIGLMSLMVVRATPQTSDADLKAAQNSPPVITVGGTMNYAGVPVSFVGDVPANTFGPFTGAASLDFTSVTSVAGGAVIVGDGVVSAGGLSNLLYLVEGTDFTVSFNNCSRTSVADLIAAWANATSGTNISANNNPINADIGTLSQQLGEGAILSLNNCGITHVAFGSLYTNCFISLSGNNIVSLDWTAGGAKNWSGGNEIDLSNNGMTTITSGDGASSGITQFQTGYLNLSGNALTHASEDGMLAMFVTVEASIPGQVGNVDLSGGTNAAPDSEGAGDISTLVAAGWTITTN